MGVSLYLFASVYVSRVRFLKCTEVSFFYRLPCLSGHYIRDLPYIDLNPHLYHFSKKLLQFISGRETC